LAHTTDKYLLLDQYLLRHTVVVQQDRLVKAPVYVDQYAQSRQNTVRN